MPELNLKDASVASILIHLNAEMANLKETPMADKDRAVNHLRNIQTLSRHLALKWSH